MGVALRGSCHPLLDTFCISPHSMMQRLRHTACCTTAHDLAAPPQLTCPANSMGITVIQGTGMLCRRSTGVSACILDVCAQVKFNVNRVDNMVIQAIALLDTWHFPELVKVSPPPCQPCPPCLEWS